MRGVVGPRPIAGVILALAFAALGIAEAQEIEADARLEPTLAGVGQLVVLTVEARVEGGLELELEPQFELEKLEIIAGPSQSQRVSFVNGRVSRSQTLSWSLRATDEGTARVLALTLTVNDQIFDLPEQVIEVQAEPVDQVDPHRRQPAFTDPFEDFFDPGWRRRRATSQPEPKLFLRAEATPRDPYVGQQVLYSLILFTQTDVGSVSPENMPSFEGLWTVEIEQPRRPRSVMTEVQGERYGRVVLLQRALFPMRPGRLTLEPVEATLLARIPEQSWMGIVGSYDKQLALASNAITLEVRPLPDDAPDGFSGAVGDFTLETVLEPREIEVGGAATLSLSLSGKGHVDSLTGPVLPALDGIQVFPPQKSGGNRAVGTTVQGEKSWSYVLVPQRPGVWEIPVASYTYFDPTSERYETTKPETLVLVARPGSVAADSETADAARTAILPAVSAEIDANPDATPPKPSRSAWLGAIAGGAIILALLPIGIRSTRRWRATAHLRRQLAASASIDKPRLAAQAIEQAWRDFLEERWKIEPTTACGDWPARLSELGVHASKAAEVTRLVEDLHYLRYAPELSAQDSLRSELLEHSRRLARLLG